MYKHAIVIGRFQPFHIGHSHLISHAESIADKVTILVGSANKRRCPKNPFNWAERKLMIRSTHPNVKVLPLNDYMYDDTRWATQVRALAPDADCIVAFDKDESSYYIKMFPELKLEEATPFEHGGTILNATQIREQMYKGLLRADLLPEHEYIEKLVNSEMFKEVHNEHKYNEQQLHMFKDYPFPQSLNCCTADSVVVCGGHILLIRRRFTPGKGCLALPGGHLDSDETFEQCALRELREETKLKVPTKVLLGSLKKVRIFDHPQRSLPIRKPTVAHFFQVEPDFDGSLPRVKAADDAVEAKWYRLCDVLDKEVFFDDHEDIIRHFTKT